MASRRSSKLRIRQEIEPADPVPARDLRVHPTERKASASKVDALFPPPKAKQTKPPGPKAQAGSKPRNTSDSAVQPVPSALPHEIIDLILDQVTDPSTMRNMARTCKKFYSVMMPRLHQRVAVNAGFHADIQKLIQSIEPYLSRSQMRALRKEKGEYNCRQKKFSPYVAEHQVPQCASFVRQLIVGDRDPDRKHEHIIHAYLNEALENMRNLQIVESMPMTKSIAQNLATMEHLQALSIDLTHLSRLDHGARPFLRKIKNLKHLSVKDNSSSLDIFGEPDLIPQIIVNSRATLRSLIFIKGCSGGMPAPTTPATGHEFPNLKSLSLGRTEFDTDFSKWLQRSIDFMRLRELYHESLGDDQASFFDHLATLAASKASSEIALRTFFVDLSIKYTRMPQLNQLRIDAQIRFLSSFDTLTSLELYAYNKPSTEIPSGNSETLLDAILKHKSLKTLKISYVDIDCSFGNILYISAANLTIILDGLPLLEEIQFAPETEELAEIGRALTRGANLKSITYFPAGSLELLKVESYYVEVLKSILWAFVSHSADASNSKAESVWEDHTKLREISINLKAWQVSSPLAGRAPEGAGKPTIFFTKERREVMCYDVSYTKATDLNRLFDPTYRWVERVARDMN
ncbi:unnamed protein product [Clonostachys byssicola]|uniref:F-box domain-containing protein n=1 Tax=Clonostachys byssicola TaxID=160290 RepID=A0A9N9U877_9HYPO|nr:unnamed protein product [Clonostachys byssicola]